MIEYIVSPLPIYAILVSSLAVIPIVLSDKHVNVRESFTIFAAFTKFFIVLSIYFMVRDGKIIEYKIIEFLPGLSIKLTVDSFGVFFALMASFLWIVTSFYSIGYMRGGHEKKQTRFYAFFAISMSAAIGAAFSGNLLTLYIFYEIITFATYPLVAHKETEEAIQGARRYLSYLLLTSVLFFLPALVYLYITTGSLDFSLNGVFKNTHQVDKGVVTVLLILFVFGSAKAAVMPFHLWLPSAMVAPTPVSALLHAVAVVKTGVFVIVRVFVYIFGVELLKAHSYSYIVSGLAAFTILVGSMVALRQDNIKARLAYSTVSQLSYIVLAVSLLSPKAIVGSIMHIVAHGFGKITLFFWAGAVYVAAHKTKVSELSGIAKKMPFTMAAFTIGALSMIGFPPFGGFISKWFIANGAVESHNYWVIGVLVASALLNASYFVPIFIKAYLETPVKEEHHDHNHGVDHGEASMFMVVPMLITAAITITLFFYPDIFLALAEKAIAFPGGMK
ncbi:MAG: monovalent cation/H+ antiporter subunit D family protein [Calditerrivibrio sp.]|nr:monovalent cation/H+ antiporter subunit D family protein [Calditerrivibrio sp.]